MASRSRVTRVELIDEAGRQYVRNDLVRAQAVLQDNGKTLKIFINRFSEIEGDILDA